MRYWRCIKTDGRSEKYINVGDIFITDDNGCNFKWKNGEKAYSNINSYGIIGYEFIELIKVEGENKMEDLRELIKPCMIVVHIDNTLSRVEINNKDEKIISGDTHWCKLNNLSEELIGYNGDSKATIKEIYGYSEYNNLAYKLSIEDRPLIWKREEKSPKQLEIESIEADMRKLADRLNELKEK